MPLVKFPNGRIGEVNQQHFDNVIARQHPTAEIVNSTASVAIATKEVEAKAPIQKAEPKKATRKKTTRKKRVVKKEV